MFHGFFPLSWWGCLWIVLALTHVTIVSVTIFLHRHQAHRALELHAIPSHFFRLWLWLTTGMGTREWASIHRKHHAKCETPEDPHSPQVLGIHKVLWTGVFLYVKEARNRETLARYGHGTPDDWMERRVYVPFQKGGIVIMLAADLALFGPVGALIWLAQVLWIPFWAAGVINGLGHFWGYRNFACADASTNLFPWGILIGGEELHNNHHAFATSAKLSNKWYEFDIGWGYIRILEILGLARVKKVAPTPRLAELRPAVDLETLQAVITHRYDLMARYMQSLRQIAREEVAMIKATKAGYLDSRRYQALVARNSADLASRDRQDLDTVLLQSSRLSTVYAMRDELATVWARSSASSEQLLSQLQAWCQRAEESGIAQLEELSLRLRRYAVA